MCYCVAPLTYRGQEHFIVASEKEFACLLFDIQGNQVDKIWDGPGGTMSAVQLPGSDGVFLATHKFYSPNNAAEAKIVLVWPENGKWCVRTLLELPYVHRFDILTRDGVNYLVACCLKSGGEYKDDWRFPGKTYVCRLPEDLAAGHGNTPLKPIELLDNMPKNHGYCRDVCNGVMSGIIACETGIFRITPPSMGGCQWEIEKLIDDPTSDAVLIDLDGCGTPELVTIGPFHGDTLSIYKYSNGNYKKQWQYDKEVPFAHALCGASICRQNVAILGHRKGSRDLLMVRWEDGAYQTETIDHDTGAANVLYRAVDGRDVVIAANREINEVAYYTFEEDTVCPNTIS